MRPGTIVYLTCYCLATWGNFVTPWQMSNSVVRSQYSRHAARTTIVRMESYDDDSNGGEHGVLENEEPLSVIFQRGLVLQRSGDHEGALKEYKFFIKAAEGCGVSPEMFAEVHVNIGAVYFKDIENEDLAKHHFELAIQYRPIGTAYVNLALIALRKGSKAGASDPATGRECLVEARSNLEKAIGLNDSEQTKAAAVQLLEDVNAIMGQMNNMR
mmetsp:Transcript_15927/g.36741  ORF Transcript_15927/g.36741 Transcript_15927/m.36741 type:complete len:214 (-) Transcript_15927:625-1266(-)